MCQNQKQLKIVAGMFSNTQLLADYSWQQYGELFNPVMILY